MMYEREYYENPTLWIPDNYDNGPESKRLHFTLRQIPDDASTILDVGCGSGALSNKIKKKFSVGADRSLSALRLVTVPRLQSDIANIPFDCNAFDMVISSEVIEHIPLPMFKQSLVELARVARSYILISVPYKEEIESRQVTCPACKCHFHKYFHMRSFDLPDLECLFDECQNIKLVKAEGIVQQKFFYFVRELVYFRDRIFPSSVVLPLRTICPQCGYTRKKYTIIQGAGKRKGRNLRLKSFIKQIWPKKKEYLWWLALYSKT